MSVPYSPRWGKEFRDLVATLPPDHRLLINGPLKSGSWSVGVVYTAHPAHQLLGVVAPIGDVWRVMKTVLDVHLETV